jgi:hypothetical protein
MQHSIQVLSFGDIGLLWPGCSAARAESWGGLARTITSDKVTCTQPLLEDSDAALFNRILG